MAQTPQRSSRDSFPPVERVAWRELRAEFIERWGRPRGEADPEAEHVGVIGPTGGGKTTVIAEIVSARASERGTHVVFIASKSADSTLGRLGWPVLKTWPPGYGQNQVIFWPPGSKPSRGHNVQRSSIRHLLDELWTPKSNRVVVFDEVAYLESDLGLKRQVIRYWREARSLGITLVAGTQRPREVSRHTFSEPSWLFLLGMPDEDERKRLGEIGGNRRRIMAAVEGLREYEFVMIRSRTGELYISKVGT